MELKVKLTDGAPLPKHAKPGDAGLDLTSREEVCIWPGDTRMVGTGIRCEIPEGYFGLVAPRSGLASKHNITLANSPGIVDSGYRGEIKAALINLGNEKYEVALGERVAQLIIVPYASVECVPVDDLEDSVRGSGGFGSSGRVEIED